MLLLASTILLSCIIAWLYLSRGHSKMPPLPPGPKPLPIVGNLHQMPRVHIAKTYGEWSKLYEGKGDVVYMHVFGREFVILNSLKVALDLFDKRSGIYSTRPRLVMAGELVGREKTSILFTKYGTRLKQCRKLVHAWINQRAVVDYWPIQEMSALKLLGNLLEHPDGFSQHIRTNAASVILKLTYGIETVPVDDPHIAMSEELSKITAKASQPGKWLVDSFPILGYIPSWFPGANFQRWARDARKVSTQLVKIPYEMVKSRVADGTAGRSWTADHLLTESGKPKNDPETDILICAAGSLYAGGIDTVVSLIRTFFLMMARHPDVQKKAQQEIDSIVGAHRLPGMQDKGSLPYIDCLIKELLRINPIVPLVPHSLDVDDVYEGRRIPKGAWVMVNLRAIMYDPSAYNNPNEFVPERFDPELGDRAERDPTSISFGFGRRFCPGYHFSQATVFLNITHVLATFDITPVKDATGCAQPPPFEFDVGHLSAASPFQCKIQPRSEEKADLVRQALAGLGH